MKLIPNTPTELLDCRTKYLDNFSYKIGGNSSYGMDVAFSEELAIDANRMSIVIPFADGNARDGVGDLLEIGGIDCSRHRKNPVALFDHGKSVGLPIGLAEDPDTHQYTVSLDTINKKALANVFFYQGNKRLDAQSKEDLALMGVSEYDHALFCEQLFDLMAKRYVRAGSIGYQVVKAYPLQSDYMTGAPQGLHLLQTLMLECSAVVMPANADTVRKALSLPKVCNKPLSNILVKSLSPYAQKATRRTITIKPTSPEDERGSYRVETLESDGSSNSITLPAHSLDTEIAQEAVRESQQPNSKSPPTRAWNVQTNQEIKDLPSEGISPEKARQILHDGEANGKPLTEKQRRMFGAAAHGKAQPYRAVNVYPNKPNNNIRVTDERGKIVRDITEMSGEPEVAAHLIRHEEARGGNFTGPITHDTEIIRGSSEGDDKNLPNQREAGLTGGRTPPPIPKRPPAKITPAMLMDRRLPPPLPTQTNQHELRQSYTVPLNEEQTNINPSLPKQREASPPSKITPAMLMNRRVGPESQENINRNLPAMKQPEEKNLLNQGEKGDRMITIRTQDKDMDSRVKKIRDRYKELLPKKEKATKITFSDGPEGEAIRRVYNDDSSYVYDPNAPYDTQMRFSNDVDREMLRHSNDSDPSHSYQDNRVDASAIRDEQFLNQLQDENPDLYPDQRPEFKELSEALSFLKGLIDGGSLDYEGRMKAYHFSKVFEKATPYPGQVKPLTVDQVREQKEKQDWDKFQEWYDTEMPSPEDVQAKEKLGREITEEVAGDYLLGKSVIIQPWDKTDIVRYEHMDDYDRRKEGYGQTSSGDQYIAKIDGNGDNTSPDSIRKITGFTREELEGRARSIFGDDEISHIYPTPDPAPAHLPSQKGDLLKANEHWPAQIHDDVKFLGSLFKYLSQQKAFGERHRQGIKHILTSLKAIRVGESGKLDYQGQPTYHVGNDIVGSNHYYLDIARNLANELHDISGEEVNDFTAAPRRVPSEKETQAAIEHDAMMQARGQDDKKAYPPNQEKGIEYINGPDYSQEALLDHKFFDDLIRSISQLGGY